jgi:hypothetical protein
LPPSTPPPPGWYPDPSGAPGMRWWNGYAWAGVEQRRRRPWWRWWQSWLAVLIALGGVVFVAFAVDLVGGSCSSSSCTASGTGSTVTLTGPNGNNLSGAQESLSMTLDAVQSGGDCTPAFSSQTYKIVIAVFTLKNVGASVAQGNFDDALRFVEPGGTSIQFSDLASCDVDSSTDATSMCANSTSSPNLAPGDTATVCPGIGVPIGESVDEIQVGSAGGSVIPLGTTAVWHLPNGG